MATSGTDATSSLERKLGTFLETLNADELGLLIDAFDTASIGGPEVEGFAAGMAPLPPSPSPQIPSMSLLTQMAQMMHDMRKAQIQNMRA